jgi:predicted kinase
LPTALFILGQGGTGKSTLAEAFLARRLAQGQAWCLLDKDTVGAVFAPALLRLHGLDPADRDSPDYMRLVRDLEYRACLRLAAEQLQLGISVALPAPWNAEMARGDLHRSQALGLPACHLRHVYLTLDPEEHRARVQGRAAPRDTWKLTHWESFAQHAQAQLECARQHRIPVLNARLPLDMQVRRTEALVFGARLAAERPRQVAPLGTPGGCGCEAEHA